MNAASNQGFRLSAQQEHLWRLQQSAPWESFHAVARISILGDLDPAVLRRALDKVIERHEILRTTFRRVPGVTIPLQVISDSVALTIGERLDDEPFDPAIPPLLRLRLERLEPGRHQLTAVLPSLCADAATLDLLPAEIGRCYAACLGEEGPEPPAMQYADFAEWQSEVLESEDTAAGREHWARCDLGSLADGSSLAEPGVLSIPLHGELAGRWEEIARRWDTPIEIVLLSAWQTLLQQLSGESEVTVAVASDGRKFDELCEAFGLYATYLPVRGGVDGDVPFSEQVQRVRAALEEARDWQECFSWRLRVGAAEPEPFLPFAFSWRQAGAPFSAAGLTLAVEEAAARFDRCEAELHAERRDGGLALELRHGLPPEHAERLAGRLLELLRGLVESPDAPAGEVEVLSAAERRQLQELNDTAVPFPRDLCFHTWFESRVACAPEARAVVHGANGLAYGELNKLANRLARHLRRLGVGPEVRVGICLERSPEMVVGILGILKAGGAYVPIDPAYPEERRSLMASELDGPVLLTLEQHRETLAGQGLPLLCLDSDWGTVAREKAENLGKTAAPENLAYVIYTSGSTGRPKGVLVAHRNLVHSTHARVQRYGEVESFLLLSSFAFDSSVAGIFGTLASGGTLVLPDEEAPRDVPRIAALLSEHRISHLLCLPSLHAALLDFAGPAWSGLRAVIVAGEACPTALLGRHRERLPWAELWNEYGPTEGSVWSTVQRLVPGPEDILIGKPIANVRVHLLSPRLQQVPMGVPGELFVAGEGVTRGYHERPDLTAERFLPNPFDGETGDRMYRTGDLIRHREDGALDFLGRVDNQVKIRGYRIELEEVEAALARHPGLREVAVVAREEGSGERRLVAYFIADPGATWAGELRTWLRERLPEPMVPAVFVPLPDLPRTANGKVDRKALPAPGAEQEALRGLHVPPAGVIEEVMADIWSGVLGLERVGVTESFFDLGGHSLLATQMVSRLREALQVDLTLAWLFEAPTVRGLAARVEGARGVVVPPPIERADRSRSLPLSFAQQRLWFLQQLDPESTVYNVPGAYLLAGELNVAVLEQAIQKIVWRHEALRTTFPEVESEQVQRIHPLSPVRIPRIDLTALPAETRRPEAERLALQEIRRPFDLMAGPVLRLLLLNLGESEYVLCFNLHHIISDGWSFGVLVRELTSLYTSLDGGGLAELPELPVQYADFAAWQRGWLQGERLDSELAFWRDQLAGAPPMLDLATDRLRPAVQSFRGTELPFRLEADLSRKLLALSRAEGVTPFMLLLAAYQTLLARYTRQNDLCVGVPIAGRNRREIEPLIGCFVNTLVLRAELSGDQDFRQILRQGRERTLLAYAHQDLPFEKLVEELSPKRSLAHTPLFQAVLAWEHPAPAGQELPGLRMTPIQLAGGTVKFDLTLSVRETQAGLEGAISYGSDLFDATTIERLIGHFERLLSAAVAAPELALSKLPLLFPAERHQLLFEWNDTAVPPSPGVLLHELFEAQAARTPDAPAAAFHGETLTYAELNARADRLARHLKRLGCDPESRVGVALERSLDLIVTLLGVLKAGAAYVPLDPDYPRERLAFVLEDAAPRVLISEAPLLDSDPLDQGLGAPVPGDDRQLAYVLYTSGSTGRPKGVGVPHRALVNFLGSIRRTPGFSPGERLLAVTSLSFDIAALEIFLPLTAGGSVELASREEALDGALLAARLRASGASVMQATPATWRMLLDSGWTGAPGLRALCGGEALPRELAASLAGRTRELWNLYGPTETTVWSATARIRPEESGPVSIGRPIADTRIHLLDPELQAAPLGALGELWIGGTGLARGYLGRPDLTAERFLPDPLAAEMGEPGGRLYRTGDLARHLPGGRMEVLGRIDHQVKIRGFRIELGEIEAVLTALPEIREAVVLAREDRSGTGDRRLVAYVVGGTAEGSDAEDALLQALRERLPDYMVPSAFVRLPALPLTPNGKVDRKALPAPEWQRTEGSYLAPRTPVEEVLAGIWAEVLGLERVGVGGHFFDLGGHSLLATQVMSRLRSAFGVEMPLRDLFVAPRLADLAARIEAVRRTGTVPSAPPLLPMPQKGPLPLSFAQQRLWFFDRLVPGSPLYNLPSAVRLSGSLDFGALAASCSEIVRRHEALRTTFAMLEGSPVQRIQPAEPFRLPVVDLSGLPESRRETLAPTLTREEAARPFDLTHGPLLRGLLLRLADSEHIVALTLHHIVSDAWSMGILVREVAALYPAFAARRPSPLPELPVQYADFALWQSSWLVGEVLEQEIAFWHQQLAGLPPLLKLPTDLPRPAVQSFRGATRPVRLPAELTRQAEALGRREGATLFMVLLAGFQALLARYSGQDDLAVGIPIAGRNREEIEGLIGFFVNTLVLRGDLAGEPTFRELLGRVRETALAAYMHQDLPFEKLVEELAPERSLAHTPLFQVTLALQNAPTERLEIQGLSLRPVGGTGTMAKFDLSLALEEQDGGLSGALEHATDLFDGTTVDRLIGHFERLLVGLVEQVDRRAAEVSLLTAAETLQLASWNVTAREYPQASIHELFAEQAERSPNAVAVAFGGQELTYREIGRRSHRLAHRLRRSGVGPGSLVGLCAESLPEMVVGMLGILAAGGAYVPLDPAYPQERLAFMVEDTGAAVLVAEESLAGRLPARKGLCVELLDRAAAGGEEDSVSAGPRLANLSSPGDPAYVIYTSGSTGRPKGVVVPHRAVVRLVRGTDYVRLGPDDRVAQASNSSFDAATFEVWGALLNGGRLVGMDRETLLSPARLAAALRREGVTVLFLTTALFNQIAREVPAGLAPLRCLLFGGERVDPAAVRAVLRDGPPSHLLHVYGPTETTTFATWHRVESVPPGETVPIGQPLANGTLYVLAAGLTPLPVGVPGELYLGGDGLAHGYHDRPELTAERFVPDPFGPPSGPIPGGRLYRTGDLVRRRPDGPVEFLGRLDGQVKIRGFRVEPGEIEALLLALPGVRQAAVVVREDRSRSASGDRRLVAYVAGDAAVDALRQSLRARLPDYMVPAAFMMIPAMPLTPNGKVDRKALPAPEGQRAGESYVAPRMPIEKAIAEIWAEVLGLERIGVADHFFDLGGHSLLLAQVHDRLLARFDADLPLIDLFAYPTVSALASHLAELIGVRNPAPEAPKPPTREPHSAASPVSDSAEDSCVAVIGFALRVPGALSPEELWRNLCAGVESIQFPTDEELIALGVSPARLRDPRYVKARSCLDGIDLFDADFFRLSPIQAALMDPQQRVFLECAWEALENAGYGAGTSGRPTGVYAGKGSNTYIFNLFSNPEIMESVGLFQTNLVNEKDHLATRVSYLFDLEGPSVTVQTACSTSLVAVHLACQGLLGGECGMALAGGVSIDALPQAGYRHQEGGISSPDGHCRPFDADAAGTITASGVGVVVLKRLRDALADGDTIHAVIRGSAINNDGAAKVGYTAPRIEGQARAIREAQRRAGVRADDITYIEAHGTATELGDPIEVAALTQAFRATTARKGFCALGSVKSNFGHCDIASGVAGLIKAVLCLEHEAIPPSLHFRRPNPKIDMAGSPFYVNTKLAAWERGETPRHAGVSSFGIGGTNAHVVLEEAPEAPASAPSRPWQMLVLSARTNSALETATAALGGHLRRRPDTSLADVTYTLQVGRSVFSHRRVVLCRDAHEAAASLGSRDADLVFSRESELRHQPFVFLFPGQGSQHVDMGRELYETEPIFRREVDHACDLLRPVLGLDLREILYPREMPAGEAARRLGSTALAQPALFVVEHALARLWMSWLGVPAAMIGHSLGEYVVACLAGVFSLEQALTLVAARGRLMEETRPGAMLAVPLDEEEVLALAGGELSLAAVNGPSRCVVSGPEEAVEALRVLLAGRGLEGRRVPTSHAFHSSLMDPILELFAGEVRKIGLKPPRIPYISNLTGTWITADEATDPEYWCRHLRRTVRFEEGLRELWRSSEGVLLEAGPGRTLTALAGRHPGRPAEREILSSLGDPREPGSDLRHLLTTLGRLWLAGVTVDWPAFYTGERRRRVPLPTYPFERQRHWIDAGPGLAPAARRISGRFQAPAWVRSTEIPAPVAEPAGPWLLFLDACGVGEELARRLKARGEEVIAVAPGAPEDHASLVRRLREEGRLPAVVAHLGSVTAEPLPAGAQNPAFDSVLSLARAFQTESPGVSRTIAIVSNHLHAVTGDEALCPGKAGVLALCELPELPGARCRNIDIALPAPGARGPLLRLLDAELAGPGTEPVIALRGRFRWERTQEPVRLDRQGGFSREDGAWLVTGGPAARSIAAELARSLAPASRIALAGNLAALRTDPQAEAPRLRELEAELGRERNVEWMIDRDGLEASLGRLCSSLVLDYFRRGGVPVAPGQVWRGEELRRILRIAPGFHRFFDCLLAVLRQDGLLAADGASLLVLPAVDEVEPAETLEAAIARQHPEYAALVRLLSGCVSRYGEALSGEIPAIEVLYPQGRRSAALDEDGSARDREGLYIELLCRFLTRLADDHPGRELRILEVGAGMGYLTRAVLPALAGRRVSYTFTDIGRTFVRAAELEAERLGRSGMSFRVLDISAAPAQQGFEENAYDAVLGFNVVHATADLGESVGHLKRLLGPGGILALIEPVKPAPWIDLVWGLADGWWSFTDKIRQLSPLVGLDTWERVLSAQGLESVAGLPSEEAERSRRDFGLILGRKSPALPQELGDAALLLDSHGLGDAIREARQRLGDLDRVLCVDPGPADLGDLAAVLNEPDEPGIELVAVSSTRPAGIAERGVVASLATLAARPEGGLRLLRFQERPSAREIAEVLERALASELTEILVASRPDETPVVKPASATPASRPQEQGNAVEARIVEIWRELIGTPLGLHDNFFEKGADSLTMLSLTAKIRDTWQVDLPLRIVMEAPTVAELAAKVGAELARRTAEARQEPSHTLVEIQSGRPHKVPFFTVHTAGGNVLRYYKLALHLGGDRPVYALQAPGLEQGDKEIFTRLEDLAAHHVAAIRTLRPHGPYLLGGWSGGGIIAFEMAQQLRRMGEEVPLVALMDTYAPQVSEGFDELKMLLWQAWRFSVAVGPEDFEGLASYDARLDRIVDLAFERGTIPPQVGKDQARRLLTVEMANLQAILDYRAEPYPGRLSYFRCTEGTDFGEFTRLFSRINEIDHVAGWTLFSPQPMPVFDIPGNHGTALMDELAVGVLARHLSECFAEVERELMIELRMEEPA